MINQRIEDVYIPDRVAKVDPKTIKTEKDQEKKELYWERQAKEARAKREYLEEQAMSKRITEPQSPPEPPVKITGEVSLGRLDFQEQQRAAQEVAERERKESREREAKLMQERDDIRAENQKLQFDKLTTEFNNKVEQLASQIQKGMSQRSFGEQYSELVQLAGQIGLVKPDNSSGLDPNIRLETMRLQQQMAREEREFKWRMRQDDKNWQLELKKLETDSFFKREELERQKKRDDMFASAPEILGRAVGKALMDRGEEETPAISASASKRRKAYPVEAGIGESGSINCPECGSPIGIGPTARTATCANCSTKLSITRVKTPEPEPEFAEEN